MTQLTDLTIKATSKADEVYTISYKKPIEKTRKISHTGSTTSTASAADFEKAIQEAGYGKFNYLILLLAFPASCASVIESTSLSFVLPTASCDLQLDAFDRGYLNGAIFGGMITSAFFWGFVADRFGRQKTLVIGYLGDVIFSIAASMSHTFWLMFVFKFLSGLMICGPFSIFMAYLSELFQSKHRDSVVMMVGLFQSVGGIFQSLLAWAIIPSTIRWTFLDGWVVINSWRVFLLICSLPALISGIGIAFSHESPKFLLSKGKKDEALRVFRFIYSVNTGRPKHTYSIRRLKRDPNMVTNHRKQSVYEEGTALFRPPYLYKALFAFAIQFGVLTNMNTMKLWLPQLFSFIKQMEGESDLNTCDMLGSNYTTTMDCDNFKVDTSVYVNMMYVNLLTTISFSVCTGLMKHIGKRNLLVTLFSLQSAVICLLGWVHPPLTVALAAIFVALASTSYIGVLGFVVQMFPTNLRTMAVSLTMMSGRIGVCAGNAILPFFLNMSCPGTFIGISVISLFCGFALFAMAILVEAKTETKEKSVPAA